MRQQFTRSLFAAQCVLLHDTLSIVPLHLVLSSSSSGCFQFQLAVNKVHHSLEAHTALHVHLFPFRFRSVRLQLYFSRESPLADQIWKLNAADTQHLSRHFSPFNWFRWTAPIAFISADESNLRHWRKISFVLLSLFIFIVNHSCHVNSSLVFFSSPIDVVVVVV